MSEFPKRRALVAAVLSILANPAYAQEPASEGTDSEFEETVAEMGRAVTSLIDLTNCVDAVTISVDKERRAKIEHKSFGNSDIGCVYRVNRAQASALLDTALTTSARILSKEKCGFEATIYDNGKITVETPECKLIEPSESEDPPKHILYDV